MPNLPSDEQSGRVELPCVACGQVNLRYTTSWGAIRNPRLSNQCSWCSADLRFGNRSVPGTMTWMLMVFSFYFLHAGVFGGAAAVMIAFVPPIAAVPALRLGLLAAGAIAGLLAADRSRRRKAVFTHSAPDRIVPPRS